MRGPYTFVSFTARSSTRVNTGGEFSLVLLEKGWGNNHFEILPEYFVLLILFNLIREFILRMGENIGKWSNWQRVNFQNIQTAHAVQYQKNKNLIKMQAKDLNRYFSKDDKRLANKHMKRCSISLIHWRNANRNYNELSLHTDQNGHHHKIWKQEMPERLWSKGNPLALLVGMWIDTAAMENSMGVP